MGQAGGVSDSARQPGGAGSHPALPTADQADSLVHSAADRPTDPAQTTIAHRRLPLAWALVIAAAAGAAQLFAFPAYDQWWLAPIGVALLAVAAHRQRVRVGLAVGAICGLTLFVPLLSWTNIEVGQLPWLLLAGLQASFVALLGAAAAYASPVVDRWPATWPLLTALLWVGQEALRSRIPFGGFPWGRLAFSQTDGPLLGLAALGGAPLVSAAVALVGGLLAMTGWRLTRALADGHVLTRVAAPLVAAAAATGAGLLVPAATADGPPVTVAVVQGNVPRLGLGFNAQRQAVLNNHVTATLRLADQVRAGQAPAPDLVVWPENASDIDPLADPNAAAEISRAADAVNAPILVRGPDPDQIRNVGLVWLPGRGPDQMYTKRHPVPFAEYLPLESVVYPVARAITPAVDRVAGFSAGDQPGVLTLGPAQLGNVICFEVAYDSLVRDTVTGGGQLLAVQTNNATFNEAEARQQLAMVRLRAVEHGRWSLMASTVGVSGFVSPDGRVHHATGFFTQEIPVRTLFLSDHRTMATTVGWWPELVLAIGGLAALILAHQLRRRSARLGPPTPPPLAHRHARHED
jgi:apolipoprotein N-acyltransferase